MTGLDFASLAGGVALALGFFALGELSSLVWLRVFPPPKRARYIIGTRTIFATLLNGVTATALLLASALGRFDNLGFLLGLYATGAVAGIAVYYDLLKERRADSKDAERQASRPEDGSL